MKMHGSDFGGWILPFGCLIHYRPPKPVLKSLAKFSPTTIPGLFLGWHVEPGCGFHGDYMAVALEKFKTPDQTSFHAHRVKEIVNFDATSFSLQAAMVESMIEVSAPTKDGGHLGRLQRAGGKQRAFQDRRAVHGALRRDPV